MKILGVSNENLGSLQWKSWESPIKILGVSNDNFFLDFTTLFCCILKLPPPKSLINKDKEKKARTDQFHYCPPLPLPIPPPFPTYLPRALRGIWSPCMYSVHR